MAVRYLRFVMTPSHLIYSRCIRYPLASVTDEQKLGSSMFYPDVLRSIKDSSQYRAEVFSLCYLFKSCSLYLYYDLLRGTGDNSFYVLL